MNIHENYEMVGAYQVPEYDDSKRMPLRIYDDMFGGLFLAGHEFGAEIVIRAGSFQDAWEIWVDETKSIDPDEVNEAYGLDEGEQIVGFDLLDLVEGYEYQANSTGTGIVNMGHYAWMEPLTKEIAERHGIVIQVSEI
jgi:hypothetical protein